MNKYVQLCEALIQYMDAKTVTLHPLVQVWSNVNDGHNCSLWDLEYSAQFSL